MSSQSPPTGTEPIPAGKSRPLAIARRKRRWGVLSVLLVIIAGTAGGAWYLNHEGKRTAIASQRVVPRSASAETVSVEVVHPKRGGMERVSAMNGSVHSFESASLLANVSGYLKSQEIDLGGKRVP